jgi:hypothetical protein
MKKEKNIFTDKELMKSFIKWLEENNLEELAKKYRKVLPLLKGGEK